MQTVRQVLRAYSVAAASPGSIHDVTRDAFARDPLWKRRVSRFPVGLSTQEGCPETFFGRTRVYVFAVDDQTPFPLWKRAGQSLQKPPPIKHL